MQFSVDFFDFFMFFSFGNELALARYEFLFVRGINILGEGLLK